MQDMGTRISQYRQNLNMTQEELATKLGVTAQAVSKWERNQSLPDIETFSQVCNVLNVSADILLETKGSNLSESNDLKINEEIRRRLRNCQEPLELIFGQNLIDAFKKQPYAKFIEEQRLSLTSMGILMPIVRIRDDLAINPNEFMILSYHRVLHSEQIDKVDEKTVEYLAQKLGETVQKNYGYILNYDIVKMVVENLKFDYPALVENVIPNRISYSMLKKVFTGLLERGDGLNYLVKTIEVMDEELQRNPSISIEELISAVAQEIEREDNYWVLMANR